MRFGELIGKLKKELTLSQEKGLVLRFSLQLLIQFSEFVLNSSVKTRSGITAAFKCSAGEHKKKPEGEQDAHHTG